MVSAKNVSLYLAPVILSAITIVGWGSEANAVQWEALPAQAPAPATNPTTPEKVTLGKKLFFDPRLSSTGSVSCNSCHNVMLGGEDNRKGSVGINGHVGGRSAPTVWNSAFSSVQFWDGRADSLEAQAAGPVTNPIEMGMPDWKTVVSRLNDIPGYVSEFKQVFGKEAKISKDLVTKAIAAFERTLVTPNSPYDRYVRGEKTALNKKQLSGMKLFASVGCVNCHSGAAFNGPKVPAGTGFYMKFPTFVEKKIVKKYNFVADKGRFEHTKKAGDKHLWKVPTLRNIALTAPYFHNGAVASLPEAVKVMAKLQLNRDLNNSESDDIAAFLSSLTGEFPKVSAPRLPANPGRTIDFKK